MSEESDLERTESPSERRLEKAREEGQVARSRELATFLLLLAAGAAFYWMGSGFVNEFSGALRDGLSISRVDAFDAGALVRRLSEQAHDALWSVLPLLALLLAVSIAAPLLLGGWLFSTKAVSPKFDRVNPLSGVKRMFSMNSLAELGKAIGKSIIVGAVGAWIIWDARDDLFGLMGLNIVDGAGALGHMLGVAFLSLTGGLAIIAALDAPLQLWRHHSMLKMTRQELRDEARESEGDPHVKGRIRSLQREAARKRMMAQVPKADVIVTNPTHYSVALSYSENMRAPRVVAKGSALIALRIREIAREHNVPIVEAPPLARALFRHAELDDEIPATLYEAVATVMAYVFQLRRYRAYGGAVPVRPDSVPVPLGMDPGAEG